MKVLVLSSLAYSLINFRGALLGDMVAAGHEVVACAPDHDEEIAAKLAEMGIALRTVRMARAGTNPFSDLATLKDLVALIREVKPDVVLAYTQKPIIYGGIAARIAARIGTTTRFFAMCSGLGHVYSEQNPGLKGRLLRGVVSFLYRRGVARAKAVFVFNRDDHAEFHRHRILAPGQLVVQVPGSGIDTTRFTATPLPDGPPTFLMIARLLRDKGLPEYVEAARRVKVVCPEARFQLLGPFDANPSSVSEAELKAWQDEGLIEYLGETRDVRPFLAQAGAFVLPTYYREGLPRTILEAMASGRAIVTTDTPGCRETIFTDENGILVPPRDAGALADALTRLATEDGLMARYGAAARRIAEQKFDVRIVNALLLGTMQLVPGGVALHPPVQRSAMRRALDIAVAAAGLAVLWPVIALVWLGVRLTMGSPALFRQRRAGLGGESFELVKFRSMNDARGADGELLPDEARTTAFGKFLRRSRLDELPELWNVLKGDMSLFGPRPLLPVTVAGYGEGGQLRGTIRPGLTGWAQIHGGPLLDPLEKLALDLWYVENRSWKVDLSIIFNTLKVVLMDDKVDRSAIGRAHESLGGRRG